MRPPWAGVRARLAPASNATGWVVSGGLHHPVLPSGTGPEAKSVTVQPSPSSPQSEYAESGNPSVSS